MTTAASRTDVLRSAWRDAPIRRLCLAVAGFRLSELAVWIALAAYAYSAGGVREASAVTVAQLVPASVFALFVGAFIRRFGAHQVLRWGLAVQSLSMLVVAVFLHSGINPAAFAASVIAATAVTTTRPTQSVLTPTMVDGPDELTAANVLIGALLAGAGLVGPASAAVIMGLVGSWAVFAVMAVIVAGAAALVWRLPAVHTVADEDPASLRDGVRAIAREPGPRIMVLAVGVVYVVIGAFDVLVVVIAVELLGKSDAFSGVLTTAAGVGCVISGSLAVAVIGRRWLAPWILAAAFAIGAALVAVSLCGDHVMACLAVVVGFGVAHATYELTALMLLQRVSRLDLLGHIFGLVESLQMAMLAVGAAVVPLAVRGFGSAGAPAAVGVMFILLVAGLGTRVVLIDRRARVPITEMAALRATVLFGSLPGPALETIAREARRVVILDGDVVVRQGDHGAEFYAIVSGRFVVEIDGDDRGDLGRGDGFGEIALLHDVPRSATVRATADAVVLAVDREPFLIALTGHAATHERASSIASDLLERE
jgi:hypothetical protein